MNPINQVLPPPVSALNDALALVRLAVNPKEAADYIEKLSAQSAAHEEARNANIGKDKLLEARESAIAGKEAVIAKRESAVTARETEVGIHAANLVKQAAQVTEGIKALGIEKDALAAAQAKHAELKASELQVIADAHAQLDARESEVAAKEAAHNERLARLKALT